MMPRTKHYYWVGWASPADHREIFKTKRDKKSRLNVFRFATLGEAKDHLRVVLTDEILQRKEQLTAISKIRSDTVEDRSR